MPVKRVARVAVSAAAYAFDKPYDYLVPDSLEERLSVGTRVIVPFGRGNRRCEGLVLAIRDIEETIPLKPVLSNIDENPPIDERMLKLVIWLRDRCFCTCYDVVKSVLPAGMGRRIEPVYFAADGAEAPENLRDNAVFTYIFENSPCGLAALRDFFPETGLSARLKRMSDEGLIRADTNIERVVSDKTAKIASLMLEPDEARYQASQMKNSNRQKAVLEYLAENGDSVVKDIQYFTGAPLSSINSLENKGIISIDEIEVLRNPFLDFPDHEPDQVPIELNAEQTNAYNGLVSMIDSNNPAAALLKGVTGSGKTEVYIRLIDHVLMTGRQVIMMVPEIALTPQLLARFFERYGRIVAVLHSALSAGERNDEWKRIKSGDARLVVGTRSAVFAPVGDLGLIIMDEEQESSYKSVNNPRYHARDVAKFRCVQYGALLLLGSATPSFETNHSAMSGRYSMFCLSERYNKAPLPDVIIADMRQELRAGETRAIGRILLNEIGENIRNGDQTILFLNRRGYNRTVLCMNCGHAITCPRCSVSMTYHAANGRLMCHYCGFSSSLPLLCPDCNSRHLARESAGTQKIEEELLEAYPGLPVIRMDADTTGGKNSHAKLLALFDEKRPSVLLGTQMVAKGLDFENVTLVGVLDADISLHANNFRSSERTFSLLAQVVGRSGRGVKEGRAVIQTFMPDHMVILSAAKQDYDGFYESEIGIREQLGYPPFKDIVAITFSGIAENNVHRAALRFRGLAERLLQARYHTIAADILGPATAAVLKINNQFRYMLLFKMDFQRIQRDYISALIKSFIADRQNRGVFINADYNPSDI